MRYKNNKHTDISKCYLCKSSQISKFYKKKSISKCSSCKFIFYDKLPSKDELDSVYSNYSRETYITSASHNKLVQILSEIINSNSIKKVLDIACGECYHLDALKEIDPHLELYATEHESAKANVLSKGFQFIDGEFYPKTDIKFDLIIFTEAIEHINDPLEFLANAHELLSPNGLIYMTTPCITSLERILMGDQWGMIDPPEHLSYFGKRSMHYALKRSGFSKVYSRSLNISMFRIIEYFNNKSAQISDSSNDEQRKYWSPQAASNKAQNIISSNIIFRFLKSSANLVLDITGLGSSLQILYKKNNILKRY